MILAPVLLLASMASDPGSHLVESCRALVRVWDGPHGSADYPDADYCLGYVQGFGHANSLSSHRLYCTTNSVTVGTITRVYLEFMQRNPRWLDEDENRGFVAAMQDSYPCRASSRR